MDAEDIKRELSVTDKWVRLLFIVLYAILFRLAELVLIVTVALQFLWTLFSGTPNASLREFGQRTGDWLRQLVHYMTYERDARPWPFGSDWPAATAGDDGEETA